MQFNDLAAGITPGDGPSKPCDKQDAAGRKEPRLQRHPHPRTGCPIVILLSPANCQIIAFRKVEPFRPEAPGDFRPGYNQVGMPILLNQINGDRCSIRLIRFRDNDRADAACSNHGNGDRDIQKTAGDMAKTMSRSRTWLINQAVHRYLDYEEWFMKEVQAGLKEAENLENLIDHEEVVKKWEAKLAAAVDAES